MNTTIKVYGRTYEVSFTEDMSSVLIKYTASGYTNLARMRVRQQGTAVVVNSSDLFVSASDTIGKNARNIIIRKLTELAEQIFAERELADGEVQEVAQEVTTTIHARDNSYNVHIKDEVVTITWKVACFNERAVVPVIRGKIDLGLYLEINRRGRFILEEKINEVLSRMTPPEGVWLDGREKRALEYIRSAGDEVTLGELSREFGWETSQLLEAVGGLTNLGLIEMKLTDLFQKVFTAKEVK